MRDVAEIVKEIIDYCEREQNYSYVELRKFANNNEPEWASVLRKKYPRMAVSEYLKSKRKKLKENGIKQPTLKESLNKVYEH